MVIGSRSVVFLYIVTVSAATINFCDKKLCINKAGPHVCCDRGKNRNGFDQSCEKPELVTLTPKHLALILELSNEIRQTVASGKLPRHAAATKMSVMSYSSELADLSVCNVQHCKYGHDFCRNSPTFKHAGQNIFKSFRSDGYMDVEQVIRRGFKAWIDESKDSNMQVINSGKINGMGHFTQCVHDRATLIGCALARFKLKGDFISLFVCDYNETNFGVVYASGRKGSDCKNGYDEKYPALCKRGEKYVTIEEVVMAKARAEALARGH